MTETKKLEKKKRGRPFGWRKKKPIDEVENETEESNSEYDPTLV